MFISEQVLTEEHSAMAKHKYYLNRISVWERDGDSAQKKSNVFLRDATGLTRQLSVKDVIVFNLVSVGLAWPLIYFDLGPAGFPGANMPATVLISIVPILIIAYLFCLLSAAFPRTGGDYVWVTRLIHPAIGFMSSFAFLVFMLSFLGPVSGWVMSFGLSALFSNLAVVTGDRGYLSLVSYVNTQNMILLGSVIMLLAYTLPVGVRLRAQRWYWWAIFIITFIGLGAFLINMGTSSPAIFKSNFNNLSGANYDSLISAASKAGFVTSFTISGTILGVFWTFLNYLGFYFSTYYTGEIKTAEKSQFIGIIGAALGFAILMIVIFSVSQYIMGSSFILAVAGLASSGNPAYTLPMAPVGQYLVIFANPNPIVAVLVPLAIMVTVIGGNIGTILPTVRLLFAWSFDGLMPAKLADVSERTGSPNYALGVIGTIVFVFIMISVYGANYLTIFSYAVAGIFLEIAIVGIAANCSHTSTRTSSRWRRRESNAGLRESPSL